MITACWRLKQTHTDTHIRTHTNTAGCLWHTYLGADVLWYLWVPWPLAVFYRAAIASSELMPPTCGCSGPGSHCPLNKLHSPTHTFMQLKWSFPDPWLCFFLSLISSLFFCRPHELQTHQREGKCSTFEWGCCCKAAAGNMEWSRVLSRLLSSRSLIFQLDYLLGKDLAVCTHTTKRIYF